MTVRGKSSAIEPEPGKPIYEDNGHRFTWHHRIQRSKARGAVTVGWSICVDCGYIRNSYLLRWELEPACTAPKTGDVDGEK